MQFLQAVNIGECVDEKVSSIVRIHRFSRLFRGNDLNIKISKIEDISAKAKGKN